MPVRSLNSAVLKWPDRDYVLKTAGEWAKKTAGENGSISGTFCFGSILTESWGVGSDLDILIELDSCGEIFIRRSILFDTAMLPVPADLLVYTTEELSRMRRENGRFIREFDAKHSILFHKSMIFRPQL